MYFSRKRSISFVKVLFIVAPYPFDVFRVSSDRSCFIHNIGDLCLFFLSLSVFPEVCQFYLFKEPVLFHFIFFYVFLFSISLISALTFNISFLLVTLGLFCSFSRFLRWTLRLETLPPPLYKCKYLV